MDAVAVLSSLSLFVDVDPQVLAAVAATATTCHLTRGQVLFTEGQPSDPFFVVVEGHVRVVVGSERGETLVLNVLGPGETLGEISLLDGLARSAGAEAVGDVTLLRLPSEVLQQLLRTSQPFCLAMAEELAQRVRQLTGSAADLVFLDLPRRLAKLLVTLADRGPDQPQSALAEQLGVTRPSLSRSLTAFQRRGWVEVSRSHVEVLDREALTRLARS